MVYFQPLPGRVQLVPAHPGETVSVKFVLDYDDADLFGTSTPYVTVIQDEYKFGGDDETIWKGSLKVGTPTNNIIQLQGSI